MLYFYHTRSRGPRNNRLKCLQIFQRTSLLQGLGSSVTGSKQRLPWDQPGPLCQRQSSLWAAPAKQMNNWRLHSVLWWILKLYSAEALNGRGRVALIIHGLLLPALLEVAVLEAAGQKGRKKSGKRGVAWPNGLFTVLFMAERSQAHIRKHSQINVTTFGYA